MGKSIDGSVLFLALGLFVQGCFVTSSSVEVGEALVPEDVEAIVPSVTTRAQILDMFGPPLVALRPGEEAVVNGPSGEDYLRYEEQFLLFADSHPASDNWSIYYYQQLGSSSRAAFAVVYGSGSSTSDRKRLWVLVDGSTGLVEGHAYRED